jgi:hypothetical protein
VELSFLSSCGNNPSLLGIAILSFLGVHNWEILVALRKNGLHPRKERELTVTA